LLRSTSFTLQAAKASKLFRNSGSNRKVCSNRLLLGIRPFGYNKDRNIVKNLLLEIAESPDFREMVRALERRESAGAAVTASGLTETAKPLYAALLRRALGKPLFFVTRSNREAEQAFDAVETWTRWLGEPPPTLIPAHDIRPYQGLSPHADISEKRALGLGRVASGQASLVVLPVAAMAARLEAADFYRSLARTLRGGDEVPLEELLEHLEMVGYARRDPVEMVGQFSLRGGILDVYSPEARRPIRVELFGDEVETIREFDVNTQRSVGPVGSAQLLPLTEFPLRRDLVVELSRIHSHPHEQARVGHPREPDPGMFSPGEPFPGWEFLVPLVTPLSDTMLDLSRQAVLFLCEPQELRKELERLWTLLDSEFRHAQEMDKPAAPPESFYLRWEEAIELWSQRPVVNAAQLSLTSVTQPRPARDSTAHFDFAGQPAPRFHGNLPLCLAEIESRLREQYRVLWMTTGAGESDRIAELLAEHHIPFQRAERRESGFGSRDTAKSSSTSEFRIPDPETADPSIPSCWIGQGAVQSGVAIPSQHILILGNQDLFETSDAAARPARPRSKISTFLSDFRDLKPGDYVVHVEHGIGRFVGLKEISHDSSTIEFMELEYQDAARLYVPRLDTQAP
jgi:transcription-repair coupling factor (superfamily II helicase)